MRFDRILRNGEVIDGTGAPARRADIAIAGDRIAAIGDLSAARAPDERDISGLSAAPGWIDAHSHSDAYLLIEPDAPSKLSQGITTEINGQCGGSAAPRLGPARLPSDWASQTYPDPAAPPGAPRAPGPAWTTVASYRALFDAVRPAINSVLFIGHNTLRAGVMGYAPRPAGPGETALLCRALEQALDEGGRGFSTGLLYQPGKYAAPEEVRALARTAAARGVPYATHMRSEGARLLEAADEAIAVARDTGVQLQISHLKTSGPANWDKIGPLLDRIERARASGIRIFSDRYPYLAAGTELDILFPDWAGAGGPAAELERLADPALREKIAAQIDASGRDWSSVMIGGAWSDAVRPFSGKTLAEAAAALGTTPGRAACRFVESDRARTGGFFFGMCADNLRRICERPWVACGSDASLRAPSGPLGADHPHPRAYGAMPRFFRLLTGRAPGSPRICRDEEAVRRMTSLPAEIFGLRGRGVLREGAFADIVVFDRDRFRETATYAEPHRYCAGVRLVFVNGGLAFDAGRFSPSRHGRFL